MLSHPQSQPTLTEEKSKKLKRRPQMKRRSQAEVMKEREDECFSCGDGGQLVSCKKPGCPKVYHADCLNLTKRPAGQYSTWLGSLGSQHWLEVSQVLLITSHSLHSTF